MTTDARQTAQQTVPAGSQAPALALAGVSFAFTQTPILVDVNLKVAAGEFVSLVGPSGAGKSTLFRVIAGLLEPGAGWIRLGGQVPARRLGQVGYMPQQDCLMPWRRVLGNATALLDLQGVGQAAAVRQARALLPAFGLAGTEQLYPHQLSGGMRQRLAFLRTVLTGRSLLLLDEPFGALDAMTRAAMQQWLLDLWERLRLSVLLITHDVEEAVLLSDRVYVLTPAGGERDTAMTVAPAMPVPLGRPRRYGLVTDPDFVALRRRLLESLQPNRKGAGGGEPIAPAHAGPATAEPQRTTGGATPA